MIDTVYFLNGNKITGDAIIMENTLLAIATDDAGKIKIELEELTEYASNKECV